MIPQRQTEMSKKTLAVENEKIQRFWMRSDEEREIIALRAMNSLKT